MQKDNYPDNSFHLPVRTVASRRIIAVIVFICLVVSTFGTMIKMNGEIEQEISHEEDIPEGVRYNLANMKDWFTENQGQIENPDVKYIYGGSDLSIGFIGSGYLIKLTNEKNITSVVKVTFKEANRVAPEGRGEFSHKSNFFKGNDSSKWKSGVRNYEKVMYEDIYDGIDLVFYTNEKGLKYDFIVNPGADLLQICWSYGGIDAINMYNNGDLHITTSSGELIEEAPKSYQIIDNEIIDVQSNFRIINNQIGFSIGSFNQSAVLVIDPMIFSTFFGGSDGDEGSGTILDNNNNIYVVGDTESFDFPTTSGSYDNSSNGEWDIFVSKFSPDGSDLLFSTFIGGSGDESVALDITIDGENNIYITGWTDSIDYPTTSNAYDRSFNGWFNGWSDALISKLSSDGSELIYSTYIGGLESDWGAAITIDLENNAYVVGQTFSLNFPTTLGCYDIFFNGFSDVFVLKLNQDGSELVYSTYIGGIFEEQGDGIEIDDDENVIITGYTGSSNFPTTSGAYDRTLNGYSDVFLLKLNNMGSDLIYSTYFGGTWYEGGSDLVSDNLGNVYITGSTGSDDFPTTQDCYDPTHNGGRDLFITKFNSDASDIHYSTYVGGSDGDHGIKIAIDEDGSSYVVGDTSSIDFPTTDIAYDSTFDGETDAIVIKLSSNGQNLDYSSFYGGSDFDMGSDIYLGSTNEIYFVGRTRSIDFPTTDNAYDSSYNGGGFDSFIINYQIHAENLVPYVSITSPANNSQVNTNVTIEGTASSDEGDIERVEVSIDTGEWEIVNGTESWHYQWNTTTVSNSEHTLRFRAYDSELYSNIEQLNLIVQNDQGNHPPDVTISSPNNNDVVNDTITIAGESSDEDDNETIETVEMSLDSGRWETCSGTTSWSFDWNTIEYENGDHSLRFRAYDGEDYSDIEELTLDVQNENSIPEVTIDYPEDGAEVTGTISITGTASDEDGNETIKGVELSFDGGGWEAATGTTSWNYDWNTTLYADETYNVEVRAFDGKDYSDVQELTLNVNDGLENIKPEVTIIAPLSDSEVFDEGYCTGTASDEDGEIEMVEISIDGGAWLQVTGTNVWFIQWDTTRVDDGVHTISVRSYDGEDYSDEVSITVTVNNEKDKEDDNWYEDPVYIGGLTSVNIVIVIVMALLFVRKRNEKNYDDWGNDEDNEEEY